ncbi:hypothetical protein BKA93DRAFT_818936 [Sparassis latifolia]
MSPTTEKKVRRDTPDDVKGRPEPTNDVHVLSERLSRDPRFNPPTPSVWKRVALLIFVVVLFWLAFSMRAQHRKPAVVHAQRYSKEFKYRPAASPVITERLKDGRTRIRGAMPSVR